jgi:hypothetical protein
MELLEIYKKSLEKWEEVKSLAESGFIDKAYGIAACSCSFCDEHHRTRKVCRINPEICICGGYDDYQHKYNWTAYKGCDMYGEPKLFEVFADLMVKSLKFEILKLAVEEKLDGILSDLW